MNNLELLGDRNLELLEQIIANKQQSLLISAQNLSEIRLARQYLEQKLNEKQAEIFLIEPDDTGKIKIDAVRKLLESTVVTPKNDRYFLIFQAESMLSGAQNALLKELEEPKSKYFFILFSTQSTKLLATIRSRTQKISLENLSLDKINAFFEQQFPNISGEQRKQVQFIAGHDLDLWQDLLEDDDKLTQKLKLASIAKCLVAEKQPYERLKLISQVGNDRATSLEFASLSLRIYRQLLRTQPKQIWRDRLEKWLKTFENLQNNGSVKLNLVQAIL